MKSKITIELDFENGNRPYIQIYQHDSDDVRDRLLKSFLEELGDRSMWCKIKFRSAHRVSYTSPVFADTTVVTANKWEIVAIRPHELPEEIRLIHESLPPKTNGY